MADRKRVGVMRLSQSTMRRSCGLTSRCVNHTSKKNSISCWRRAVSLSELASRMALWNNVRWCR